MATVSIAFKSNAGTVTSEHDAAEAAAGVYVGGNKVVGVRGAFIADPTGGATTDAEARAAIASILDVLIAHGLIASS